MKKQLFTKDVFECKKITTKEQTPLSYFLSWNRNIPVQNIGISLVSSFYNPIEKISEEKEKCYGWGGK